MGQRDGSSVPLFVDQKQFRRGEYTIQKGFLLFATLLCCLALAATAAAESDAGVSFYDHSEINWYISQALGPDAAAQCLYYDFFADSEEAIQIAQLADPDDPDAAPVLYLHCFNADIADWYRYDNAVLAPIATERAGFTAEGREIVRYDYDFDGYPFSLYIAFAEDGRIRRVLSASNEDMTAWQAWQEFVYGLDGRIERCAIGSGTYYGVFFDNSENRSVYGQCAYRYGPDGALAELRCYDGDGWDRDEPTRVFTFAYEDGARTRIEETDANGAVVSTLTLERDGSGRVLQAQTEEDGTQYSIPVQYLPGGESRYDNGWSR